MMEGNGSPAKAALLLGSKSQLQDHSSGSISKAESSQAAQAMHLPSAGPSLISFRIMGTQEVWHLEI